MTCSHSLALLHMATLTRLFKTSSMGRLPVAGIQLHDGHLRALLASMLLRTLHLLDSHNLLLNNVEVLTQELQRSLRRRSIPVRQ